MRLNPFDNRKRSAIERITKAIFRRWPPGAHAGGCFLQLGRGQDGGGQVGLPPRCGGGTPGEELHLRGAQQGGVASCNNQNILK